VKLCDTPRVRKAGGSLLSSQLVVSPKRASAGAVCGNEIAADLQYYLKNDRARTATWRIVGTFDFSHQSPCGVAFLHVATHRQAKNALSLDTYNTNTYSNKKRKKANEL
jgi:hypothetical protein